MQLPLDFFFFNGSVLKRDKTFVILWPSIGTAWLVALLFWGARLRDGVSTYAHDLWVILVGQIIATFEFTGHILGNTLFTAGVATLRD